MITKMNQIAVLSEVKGSKTPNLERMAIPFCRGRRRERPLNNDYCSNTFRGKGLVLKNGDPILPREEKKGETRLT